MTIYTVLIANNSVGTINSDTLDGQHADNFIGEVVNIHFHDVEGNPVETEGRLVEVLEVNEY